MKVKIKKLHPHAKIPTYSKNGDAGMDLTAISKIIGEDAIIEYGTGLSIEIPEGHVGLIFPRSSICNKDMILTNHVGVIDSGFRGEIKLKFAINFEFWDFAESENQVYKRAEDEHFKIYTEANIYNEGDRIGQIIILPYPIIQFEETDELSETERGTGGYGHTGK